VIPLTWLSDVPRFAMHATIATLLAAIVWNAGAAHQGDLNMRTIDNSNWCATLLHEAVSEGERSAALHASRSGAVEAFLRGERVGEVVVSADSVGGERGGL
jgi:hypothetical protein